MNVTREELNSLEYYRKYKGKRLEMEKRHTPWTDERQGVYVTVRL